MKKLSGTPKEKTAARKTSAAKKSPGVPQRKSTSDTHQTGNAAYLYLGTKTGRIVKSSPVEPTIGIERIREAVQVVVGKRS